MKKYDFKKLDEEAAYNFRQDLLTRANELGYTYISEAICRLYEKHRSMRKAAKDMYSSTMVIRLHVIRWGMKINSCGGANNIKVTLDMRENIFAHRNTGTQCGIAIQLGYSRYAVEQTLRAKKFSYQLEYGEHRICRDNCCHLTKLSEFGRCELFNDELFPSQDNRLKSSKYCLTKCIKRKTNGPSKDTRCREDKVCMRVLD